MIVVLVRAADLWGNDAPFRLLTQCWNGLERPHALKWLLKANISHCCRGETDPARCQCKEKCRQRKAGKKNHTYEKNHILM